MVIPSSIWIMEMVLLAKHWPASKLRKERHDDTSTSSGTIQVNVKIRNQKEVCLQ